MRHIVLDTETTGLSPKEGHRIIEIGCVEISNRRLTGNHYQVHIQPERPIDPGAMNVHGITNEFLQGKPVFRDIVEEFLTFIQESVLIIHNASFDLGFVDYELGLLKDSFGFLKQQYKVIDTLLMARKKHPGQRNNLDALCKRYGVSNKHRTYHGALLDAGILAEVYLAMTAGQCQFVFECE